MLDANLKKQLDTYLQNIVKPIEISVSIDDSPKGQELNELAVEIAEMSSKIDLVSADDKRSPSMAIGPSGQPPRVRFAGIPMGHEFTSLVLALLQAGGHPSKADPALLEQIRNLEGEFHFETYTSLSCQNCPDVVQALNLMATLNPNITHVMIDGALFQDEVDERQVMAVPSVYLNGEHFGQGRMTLADIVQVLDTVGIENFISVPYTEGPKLVANLEQHVKEYDVDLITEQTAQQISTGDYVEIALKSGATLLSRAVILATGARWREMNVPGEQEYRGKGVAYCPHCDGPLFKGKRVAVIGGGNSGIEAAIDLAGIVEHVTVLEFADTLRADEVLQRKARSMRNIDIIKSAQTTEVRGDGKKVVGLTYKDRATEELKQVDVAGIFVQIGLIPNTEWLKDSELNLTRFGEIEIDARGATNIPGVFAAGDVTTVPFKQIIVAMGAGSTASLAAFDHLIRTADPAEAGKQAANA